MATSISSTAAPNDKSISINPRLFSVAEYRKLVHAGILQENDRVELLDGVISPKMIHSPIHDATVSWVEQQLRNRLLPGWFLRIQSSLTLDDRSEPEPDLAIVRGTPLDYVQRHPSGLDVAMVVEVAETSIGRDRFKAAGYASANIQSYWIINLQERQIECYRSPQGADYREVILIKDEGQVDLPITAFDHAMKLKVSELLP